MDQTQDLLPRIKWEIVTCYIALGFEKDEAICQSVFWSDFGLCPFQIHGLCPVNFQATLFFIGIGILIGSKNVGGYRLFVSQNEPKGIYYQCEN